MGHLANPVHVHIGRASCQPALAPSALLLVLFSPAHLRIGQKKLPVLGPAYVIPGASLRYLVIPDNS